jgi:hypothetical protein
MLSPRTTDISGSNSQTQNGMPFCGHFQYAMLERLARISQAPASEGGRYKG